MTKSANMNSPGNLDRNRKEQRLTGFPLIFLYMKFLMEIFWICLYACYLSGQSVLTKFQSRKQPSLKQEIVLVTGGANGIGREICLRLGKYEKDLTIISWDVDQSANNSLVKQLKSNGLVRAYSFNVDVSNRAEVVAAAQKVRSEIGNVSMLFNNAGIRGPAGNAWQINPSEIEKTFQVNTLSHWWTIQEFLPSMIDSGRGHVVETCSILGFIYGQKGSAYVASKHALKAFVESVKEDLRHLPNPPNIHFSLVYPNNTLTAMTAPVNFRAGKYPFLLPKMTPSYVASRIVTGVLRNQEHIFVPSYMSPTFLLMPLLPSSIGRMLIDIVDIQMDL